MAQKTWRLVVTELGNADSLHEVSVEAGNWMTALKVGRKKIGEDGGVPTGASCAVAPDGKVTIHDPLARRSYVLFPGAKAAGDAKVAEVRAPSEGPKTEGPRSDAPRADADKKKKLNKTLAYDTRAAKKPGSSYSVPAPEPKSGRSLAPAAAAPAVAQAEAAPERTEPRSEPVPKVSDAPVAEIETASGSDFRLLSRRDEAPTTETPLFYRERVYAGAPDMTSERGEEILRGRFAELRESLAHATPGKFFHLAIFDHEFPLGPDGRGRPLRPPLATLVYKDWRGEALVQFPLEESRGTAPEPMRTADKPASVPPPARPLSTPPPAMSLAASQPPPAQEPSAPRSEPPLPIAPVAIESPIEPARVAPPSQPPLQIAEPRVEAKPEPRPEPKHRQQRTTTDEHDARLAHAFEAGQDLLFLTTPVEGLDFVVKLLGELVPCEAVSACLYDIDTDEFRFVSMSGPGSDERRGEAVPRAMGIMGAVAEMHDSAALRLTQPVSDPRFDPGVDGRVGLEPRDVLYQPVTHHGLLLGVLQLLNRASGRGFSESDADLVAYVARQAGEFLHQARMSAPGPSMSGMPRR